MTHLERVDPDIAHLIQQEETRQFESIRLIPSENYVSHAVLEATGSILTNKYSEGYPGKRYYEGQEFIDPIESMARERATRLFGADHANVQPYSGSPGQSRHLLRIPGAWRKGHGHEPAAWRAPDAWLAGEFLGAVLSVGAIHCRPCDAPDRLRPST